SWHDQMQKFQNELQWLDDQQQRMLDRVIAWANINTFTHNVNGLAELGQHVRRAFESLGAECEWIDLPSAKSLDDRAQLVERPLAKALRATKRGSVPGARRIFLGIHNDTVYAPDLAFQ